MALASMSVMGMYLPLYSAYASDSSGGVAEHDALVAGADLLELLGAHAVDALANLRGLVVELDEHAALVAVEADRLGGETDVVAHLAHDAS